MTRPRILIADDDPSIRQTLQLALTRAGYEVLVARDGAEATDLWRRERPDLVITDLHMPSKDGLEVIIEVRALSHSTPIIAMSDGGRSKHIELLGDAKLLGAFRSMAKPFNLEEMVAAVKEELEAGGRASA